MRDGDLRRLGQSDLIIRPLGLGTMTFGSSTTYMRGVTAPDAEAREIFERALSAGVNFIDTANSYSQGRTETLLGEWLGSRRNDVVLATKVGMVIPAGADPGPAIERGLAPELIRQSCEESLRRLKTDRIDLLHLHLQDTAVPVEETLLACAGLIRDGKVRYLGLSNYTGVRIMEAAQAASRLGLPPFASIQAQWSLVVRDAEREMIPAARLIGAGVLAWSPLARGFLSGKIDRDAPPPTGSRLATWRDSLDALRNEQNYAVLALLRQFADERRTTVPAVALAWLLAKPELSAVIVGARSVAQLSDNLKTSEIDLTDEELRALDEISAPDWGYPYSFISALTGKSFR